MKYTTVYTKEKTWYSVQVLELPWCISEWNTKVEAESNIKEAILLYLESMKEVVKHKRDDNKIILDSINIDYETV